MTYKKDVQTAIIILLPSTEEENKNHIAGNITCIKIIMMMMESPVKTTYELRSSSTSCVFSCE